MILWSRALRLNSIKWGWSFRQYLEQNENAVVCNVNLCKYEYKKCKYILTYLVFVIFLSKLGLKMMMQNFTACDGKNQTITVTYELPPLLCRGVFRTQCAKHSILVFDRVLNTPLL